MLRAREAPHRLCRLLRHALPQAVVRGAGSADGGRLLLLRRRARAILESQDPARSRGRLPPRRAAPLPRRRRGSHARPRPGAPSRPLRRCRQVAQWQADAAARLWRQPRTTGAVRAVDRDVAPPPHRLSPCHAATHATRVSRRRFDRRLRRARQALSRRDGGRGRAQGVRGRSGGRAGALRRGPPRAQRRGRGAVHRPVRGA
jgi:hypothetical protein